MDDWSLYIILDRTYRQIFSRAPAGAGSLIGCKTIPKTPGRHRRTRNVGTSTTLQHCLNTTAERVNPYLVVINSLSKQFEGLLGYHDRNGSLVISELMHFPQLLRRPRRPSSASFGLYNCADPRLPHHNPGHVRFCRRRGGATLQCSYFTSRPGADYYKRMKVPIATQHQARPCLQIVHNPRDIIEAGDQLAEGGSQSSLRY